MRLYRKLTENICNKKNWIKIFFLFSSGDNRKWQLTFGYAKGTVAEKSLPSLKVWKLFRWHFLRKIVLSKKKKSKFINLYYLGTGSEDQQTWRVFLTNFVMAKIWKFRWNRLKVFGKNVTEKNDNNEKKETRQNIRSSVGIHCNRKKGKKHNSEVFRLKRKTLIKG